MHYYQFNIGDYASHTRHLTLMEDLAYRKLLDHYYLHEQPLNACSSSVARLIGMREHQQEVESVLKEFFTLADDGWIQTRADREIEAFRAKIEQASKAGKASAQRRFNACSTDVQPNSKHKPITNNQDKTSCQQPSATDIAECPHQEVIALYAEKLPMLTQVRTWDGARAQNLRARWRWVLTEKKPNGDRYATDSAQAMDFFGRFFGYVAESDFLTGKDGKWCADLPWLMKAENFAKVIEGKYENREAE
jgi:uncharacterized protein YdaU (DUF1376 family)